MDLIVSEGEFQDAAGDVSRRAQELALVADSYIACLQGIKAMGYRSAASASVIDNRCRKVRAAIARLPEAVDGIDGGCGAHLDAIRAIDRSVS